MKVTASFTVTGTLTIDSEYEGYSLEELETEVSMGLDEASVNDISNGRLIGTLMIEDVLLSNRQEENE